MIFCALFLRIRRGILILKLDNFMVSVECIISSKCMKASCIYMQYNSFHCSLSFDYLSDKYIAA